MSGLMMNVKLSFMIPLSCTTLSSFVINSLYSKTKAFQKHEYSCHNFSWVLGRKMWVRERERRGRWGQNNRVIHKVTFVFGPPFTPYLLFQWYPQSKEILLNLSMKCWNSAFNAGDSRLWKKERKRKLSHFYPNILTLYQLIVIGNAQKHKPSQVNLHDFTLTHPKVKHLPLKFTKRWKRGFTHVHLHGGYVLSHTHIHPTMVCFYF
jgi:hypothetical protein